MNENGHSSNQGKYGEIWRDEYYQEYLIVKDNGDICNVLALEEICKKHAIPCECGLERYVVPHHVSCLHTCLLVKKTGAAVNMPSILSAVASALGFDFNYCDAVNQTSAQHQERMDAICASMQSGTTPSPSGIKMKQ